MFTVPIAGGVIEWNARCQYTGYLVTDSVSYDVAGKIVCRSRDDVRLEPCPDIEDADEVIEQMYVGPGPWIQLHLHDKDTRFSPDGAAWWFDDKFIGACYRIHKAIQILQKACRRKMHRVRMELLQEILPFDEAIVARICDFVRTS